jgi:dihydroneopterin aldolase
MDAIFVRGLRVHASHGLTGSEARAEREFEIDLEIGMDLSLPSTTDCLLDTICYAAIVASVTDTFRSESYSSLEQAASAVVDTVLAGFSSISTVNLTVRTSCTPTAAVIEDIGIRMRALRS